jgi:hypothetical protein
MSNEQDDPTAPPAAPPAVSRRAALRVLGTVPIAGAIGAHLAWAQQATAPQATAPQQPRQTHEAPNQPSQGPGAPPSARPLPHFFTKTEHRTASVLADDIIPRDARSPGATEAGVLAFIDFHLSAPETADDARTAVRGGLRWLDTQSRRRFGAAYASATPAQRHQILDDIAWAAKAPPEMSQGAAFFARFRDLVAAGFFSSAVGWQDLRYQGNVFNPGWHGCPDAALKKLGVSYAVMDTRVPPQ